MSLLAERIDQHFFHWDCANFRGGRALLAGDTDHAEELANQALQIGTDSGQPDARTWWGTQMIDVSHQRGTMGDLIPLIEQLVDEAPEVAGAYSASLAMAYTYANRIEDARHLLEEFAAGAFDLPVDLNWTLAFACYAIAAVAVDDPDFAGPLLEQLAPYADQLATSAITNASPVSCLLGGLATVVGRYEQADAYFSQAAATNDRLKAKSFTARTNLWWGMMHAKRKAHGDTDRARHLLTHAHTVAAANGYAHIERLATEALAQLA